MIAERAMECVAMMMIGDGVLGLVEPRRHLSLWEAGPGWWRAMFDPFLRRPGLTRCLGAAEVALGIWVASRQAAPETASLRDEFAP
jgi:hypothetical protein